MSLVHTLVQTHRHYVDEGNLVDVEGARNNSWPLLAECGTVWIPGLENEVETLPMCSKCEAVNKSKRGSSFYYERRDLPHFVYRCYDIDDRLIYVGVSVAPVTRMDQHRQTKWWFPQVARTRYTVFPNRYHAEAQESRAIAVENPRWNIMGRDKSQWTADDYMDCYTAMRHNGSDKRAAQLATQAQRRYGVDLEARWVA